ncbi:hypothetical protein RZE82_07305 [Mollicutes bacterium LVI A0039]|nr:hypothetical protein RZE82_07305 [Mollicutes bacterium LVI A0039]
MSCTFNSNQEILDKVREKGFSNDKMDFTYEFTCECGHEVMMETFETQCPACLGIFVVTPCSQDSKDNVVFVK